MFRMNTYKKTAGVGGAPRLVNIAIPNATRHLRPERFFFQLSTFDFQLLAALLVVALFATGCDVPLGPGFRLRSRQMTFSEPPAQSAPVHLRVADRMENDGNRALAFLDVGLPPNKSNFTIRVDGKTVAPAPLGDDPGAPLRVRFDPPWPAREQREIVLEYDLASDPVSGGVAAVTPQGLYLADPRALPFWYPPIGVFASGEVLTRDERFELSLPPDFRFVASGKQQRRRFADGKLLYRFRTSGKELPSFVIAGRYQEQTLQTRNGNLLFWTFRPFDSAAAQAAAERLTASAAAFVRIFGPMPQSGPLRIVEAPPGLLPPNSAGQDASVASFPEGLLLGPAAFEQGIAGEPVLRSAEAELARIWFGWRILLRSDAETLFGRGLGLFAVVLAAEARGGQEARHLEIARLLGEYDRASMTAGKESLLQAPQESTPQQIEANSRKAALFLAALDDLSGQNKFERAMLRLQTLMAGRGLYLSLDDLRSALEASTGTPMADEFRLWLNHPGIPADFRARYSTAPARQQPSPARAATASSASAAPPRQSLSSRSASPYDTPGLAQLGGQGFSP